VLTPATGTSKNSAEPLGNTHLARVEPDWPILVNISEAQKALFPPCTMDFGCHRLPCDERVARRGGSLAAMLVQHLEIRTVKHPRFFWHFL
jgi:hypothetical protein